jgi:twitching motility protein PilT
MKISYNNFEDILRKARRLGASDVHISNNCPPYIRIDGKLEYLAGFEKFSVEFVNNIIFGLLDNEKKEQFAREKNLDFIYETKDEARYRINVYSQKGTAALSARVIPVFIPSMEELKLPKVVYKLLLRHSGLILVTGPAGCGKSTTLASMIEAINKTRAAHIITLEDPIEFIYKSKKSLIRQRELGIDIFSFSSGLKHILRQDPNVILVGEMRDLDTMSTTISLAETGHLVFATLHTNSAPQTIDRIIDSFPPYQQHQIRLQISNSLQAIISQKLVTNLKGKREPVREILINNAAISNLIRENKIGQIYNVMQTGFSEGMRTMDQSLLNLYKNKIISKKILRFFSKENQLLDH